MTTSSESDSESDKGEGRGLPVGWGPWRERDDEPGWWDLYPTGSDVDERATAYYPGGTWQVWAKGSAECIARGTATPRPGETLLAAAQAAAEAALWACDGYGTGEVRGLRLPLLDISDAAALVASRQTVTLPGLSGWRIVRAARCDGGAEGVEVDAVRAPAPPSEDDPQAGGRGLTMAEIRTRYPDAWARAAETTAREASALPVAVAPVVEAGPFCEWGLCRAPLSGPPRPACGSPYQHNTSKGEPAPREPSAPTDGDELAGLLQGLPAAILAVQNEDDDEEHYQDRREVARACELLLAERAKTERRVAELEEANANARQTELELDGALSLMTSRAEEAERRVAELEAERARGRALDADRAIWDAAREQRVAALEATPPPHTVAALLAALDEKALKSDAGPDRGDESTWLAMTGHAAGLREAASLIRATLGAPSPLDGVVAEVCALAPFLADVSGGPGTVADAWRDIAREMREPRGRDGLLTISGLAMHGALACDAAKEPT